MDEDEENKGCFVRRRRSSILKLPLAGIDPNKQLKQKEIKKKRRSSKRVSFAETLDVWEFNKESQSESSDKNAFRNKDDTNIEISGIDSLLTGEIKNPAPAIENISDPEDSGDDEEAAPPTELNCSVFQSPEKDSDMQIESEIVGKENINVVISNPVNCADVSPANQSMYCPSNLDNTPQKLDNKLFFQQLMQKIKFSPNSSKDNSPVVKAARPSMSTKMFLDNLIKSTKDDTSFSDGFLGSREALPDISMDTSNSGSISNSPALDKSLYHNESPNPVDSTIYFNRNPDQTASMDFTICNSKVFSDSFKIENQAEKEETCVNMTQCFGNSDDTMANMELTVCTGNTMAPMFNLSVPKQNSEQKIKTVEMANMDLTSCHNKLFPGFSRIDHKDDDNKQMTSPGDVTRIFNETKDTMANMELTLCATQNPISFMDYSRKPACESVGKENKIEKTEQTSRQPQKWTNPLKARETGMELTPCATTPISTYASGNKKTVIEDGKENVFPSGEIKLNNQPIKQINKFHPGEMNSKEEPMEDIRNSEMKSLHRNITHNSDDKENNLKARSEDLTEKSSQFSDVQNTSSTNLVKRPVKRVSFMCPEEQPSKESCLQNNDEPPIKKLNSGNQVDLYSQNSSSICDQQVPIKNLPEKSMNSVAEVVIPKKNSTKSGVKRVSFYDPEEISKNSGSDNHNELPGASLTKSDTEKCESTNPVAKRAALTSLDGPFAKKTLLDKVTDQMDVELDAVDLEKPSSHKPLFLKSIKSNTFNGIGSNLESDSHSQKRENTDNRALRSVNTSGILKSFNVDSPPKCESMREDLPKSVEKQEEMSTEGRKVLEEKSSNVSVNPGSQVAAKNSMVNRSQNCLNRSGVFNTLFNKNSVEHESVDKNLTDQNPGSTHGQQVPIKEKRMNFFSTEEKPAEKKTLAISANTDSQSTRSPEETNKYLYISANTSGILKSYVNQDDSPDDQLADKTFEKRVTFCSADEKLSEKNSIDERKSITNPQSTESPEDDKTEANKYLYISLNNSGIIKSFSSDEKQPDSEPVDKNLNEAAKKRVSFRSADDELSSPKSNAVDWDQLVSSIIVASAKKKPFEKTDQSGPSCDPEAFDNEPTLTKFKKCASPQTEKITPAEPLPIKEDSSKEDKVTNVQVSELDKQPVVGSIANEDEIPKPEKLASNRVSLAKVPNFKTSWQGMFSIQNVIKNVKQSRSGVTSAAPCESTKTAGMSALSIMQPTISESTKQVYSKDPSQDKASVANETKEKTKNIYLNQVTNKFPSELKATSMTTMAAAALKPVGDSVLLPSAADSNSQNFLNSQPSSQTPRKTLENMPEKKDESIIYDLNFKLEDLSGIMNEKSDILIDNSHCESMAQFSSSIANRSCSRNKSVDDVKNSILALSSLNSSLCTRMLINMHMPSLEKSLSTVEVESIEELLLLFGIDKLENVTIDYRRSSVDLAPLGSQSRALGERLVMSCYEQPKYQSILQAYDSLKADEHSLLKEFHSQKLLDDFQLALKKKETSKSNDELKNELLEDFKKSRQLSQQKVKQRKTDRYNNLCSLLRGKLVILEEAKTQVDYISQKIDQQLEGLDKELDTLNKEFELLNSFPQLSDEDLDQYIQVRKYLDDVDSIQIKEEKLSNRCSQLKDQEKSMKEEYSNLQTSHANLLKPFSYDTSTLLNNCNKLKMYSILFPWRLWQVQNDRQKYNFWNDTFQFCIHTQAEHIKKAHFELDENWQTVAKDHPWLQIAHEMRHNVMQEKTFVECLQHISQLPQSLCRIGNLLNSLQDLAKEIHAVSLKKVISRKQNSILVTYCCAQLSKVQVCFQFDPSNYPTATINHQVNLHYGNVRCQDISRRLQRIKPGPQYLNRLVNAVQLESVSTPW